MTATLSNLDYTVLAIYFGALLAVAIWVFRQRNETSEDYFLAGRNAGWFVIGASIFASNIGSEHVVGLAGTGAESGVPMAHYELHAWIVLLLGWLFLPFYMRSGVFTMPEFLEKRFDSRARWFLSIFSIFGYVLTKVSVTIYAGGIVIAAFVGEQMVNSGIGSFLVNLLGIENANPEFWLSSLLVVVITGIYTIIGGMRAVIYTEALQTVVLIGGALIITFMGLDAIGGWSELKATAGSDHFNMWRPMSDPDFPWTGLLFGGTIVGIWYWCTDQYIVQRTLTAHNIQIGRRGAIFGAYLKLMPILIFLVPGIIAYALKQKGLLEYEKSDTVFPALVQYLLPSGLKGLVAGGLMAALMSSLASVFNSSSTLFTVDIFKKLYPESTERELVFIGKIATGVVVLLGIAWIPVMQKIGGGVLYQYLQSVQAYIAPPITAVFLFGIIWKRANARGAFATLLFGLIIAILRIVLELNLDPNGSGIIHSFASLNFAHFAIFNFIACSIVCTVGSLSAPAPSLASIAGLTFGSLTEEQKASAKDSYTKVDIALSVVLVIVVISILAYFTG